MKITILTLFPEMFRGPFNESIVKRGIEKGLVDIEIKNIRDFGNGAHRVVDDKPYGGGIGMVMKVDVLDNAIENAKIPNLVTAEQKVVLLDPRGEKFQQKTAKDFSKLQHLLIVCGHYEGVDERVRDLVDSTISIGDYITTGGEIPAMLITDSVVRLIDGVLKDDATKHESFRIEKNQTLLEYPQYTTPQEYKGKRVPDILLSGNHKNINEWRYSESVKITKKHRPDLLIVQAEQ